jgi:hypothetical protein
MIPIKPPSRHGLRLTQTATVNVVLGTLREMADRR